LLSLLLAAGFQLPAFGSAVKEAMTEVRTVCELRAGDWKLTACLKKLVAHSKLHAPGMTSPCASGPAVSRFLEAGHGRKVPSTAISPSIAA
jgi:hypothetical protein